MSPQAERLYQQVLQLPKGDRVDLGVLLANQEDADFDPEVEAEWGQEIKRRLDEIDSGRAKLIPWVRVREKMLRKIEDARKAAAPRRGRTRNR